MTHGRVLGSPQSGVVTLRQDEQLVGMAGDAVRQVRQLVLRSRLETYGPWGDNSTSSMVMVYGAIVGFFGCNKNGYIAGIGAWTRDIGISGVSSQRAAGTRFGSSGYEQAH
jgi:hypothetical protein